VTTREQLDGAFLVDLMMSVLEDEYRQGRDAQHVRPAQE
jgi:hypothetical protein